MAIAAPIDHYKLTDWWLSTFTAAEREYIGRVFQPLGCESRVRLLLQRQVQWTDGSKTQFLWSLATWFMKPGDHSIAQRILVKAEEVGLSEADVMGLHFTYQHMGQLYYKDRDDPAALTGAIVAWEKQIALASQVAKEIQKEVLSLAQYSDTSVPERVSNLPIHLGFEQLVLILEKQKEYSKAIEVCRLAQEQGWAGAWNQKIKRYQQKLYQGYSDRLH